MTALTPRSEEIKLHAKAVLDRRRRGLQVSRRSDVCDWAEARYWVVDEETGTPGLVKLSLFQKAVLRYPFTRNAAGLLPFTTVLLSTVKKSGKTTMAGIVARWMAETQVRMGEIYFAGNDLDQAKGRSFASVAESVKLTPGAVQRAGDWVLPNRWSVLKTIMECLETGTALKAIAVDAKGEAGANPNLTLWCVTPDTPVLTADLRWVPAGDVQMGALLVGFDEEAPAYNCSRRYQTATVQAAVSKTLPCLEIELEGDAPLRCTPEHRWLTKQRGHNKMEWRRSADLQPGDLIGQMLPTWEPDTSWEGGYVAGAYDGEGHLSASKTGHGYSLGVSQIPGKFLLEKVHEMLTAAGIKVNELEEAPRGRGNHSIGRVGMTRLQDVVRVLGTYRPMRLLSQFSPDKMGHIRGCRWRAVTAVRDVGLQPMACISTDTKTYVARGYGAHNTELWAFTLPDAVKFYTEMTPVPTRRDSIRLVETYAGYDGQSELLQDLYNTGMAGRQLTNGELATAVARDKDGERYEDFLWAFAETEGDPDALVPCWVDDVASLFMYWDSGTQARRMPWQHGPVADQYYTAQAKTLPPGEYDRLHLNLWIGAVSGFVPIEWWDACYDPDLEELPPGTDTPVIVGVDAAVTNDCFGVVMVSRYPDSELAKTTVAVRGCRKWDPKPGEPIDLTAAESFLRTICRGGCTQFHALGRDGKTHPPEGYDCPACAGGMTIPRFNIKQLAFDPSQLSLMMQRLTRDRIAWCEPFIQMKDRNIADSDLRTMIAERRLRHTCPPPGHPDHDPGHPLMELRRHLNNAAAQLEAKQDSKLRIVKKAPDRKIDLVVALSMAAKRCLYLRL